MPKWYSEPPKVKFFSPHRARSKNFSQEIKNGTMYVGFNIFAIFLFVDVQSKMKG